MSKDRLCTPLDCCIYVREAIPKTSGDAKDRWDVANIDALVGRTVTAGELVARGLIMADIRYELRTPSRMGFEHVCKNCE